MRSPVSLALAACALASSSLSAQTPSPPMFADVWIGGPLDSIYNAEYSRLQNACRGRGDACYQAELDTTAVRLAPVFADPGASEPAGSIAVRLRPRGRWPYAALVFLGPGGEEVPLLDDVGDWGCGTTFELAEARAGWLRPWLLEQTGGPWLSVDGGRGLGVVDGPYGLQGRLWRLGPVEAAGGGPELPAGVYLILEVQNGAVRLRTEVPADMDCGEPANTSQDGASPTIHTVPLTALLDPLGRSTLELAYPKGC